MVHGGAVCQLPYTFTRPKRARVEATCRVPLKGNCDSLCVHWGFANKVPRFKSWQYLHAADSLFPIVVFAYRNRKFWNKKIIILFYIWCHISPPRMTSWLQRSLSDQSPRPPWAALERRDCINGIINSSGFQSKVALGVAGSLQKTELTTEMGTFTKIILASICVAYIAVKWTSPTFNEGKRETLNCKQATAIIGSRW